MYGDNSETQEYLLHEYGIPMIPLPPYHPDLNPTELVFQTLLQHLASLRARYKCWALTGNEIVRVTTFIGCIEFVLDSFSQETVSNFYRKIGYVY
jgi:transposase